MRINAVDHFRGVAILLIVATHCFGPWTMSSTAEKVVVHLISSGSILFVFISGYLFHRIFYSKFDYSRFIQKKFLKVFLPYLLLSTVWFIYFSVSSYDYPFAELLIGSQPDSASSTLYLAFLYLWTGRIATPYWYIPVILIIYLISPLFIFYIKRSFRVRIIIFLIAFVISFLIHRPFFNASPIHSLFYYTSIYLLGINCSIDHKKLFEFLAGKELILLVVILMLALLQTIAIAGAPSPAGPAVFRYDLSEIDLIQKVFMCFFFMTFFRSHETTNMTVLKKFAGASFAIYFLHPFILWILHASKFLSLVYFLPGIFYALLTFVLTISLSLILATAIKFVLKKNSQYLIGW